MMMIPKVYFKPGAKEFVVDDGGKLFVEGGGELVIEDGGKLILEEGGSMDTPPLPLVKIAPGTPEAGAPAELTTTLGDATANADIKYTAATIGEAGNGITVEYAAELEHEKNETSDLPALAPDPDSPNAIKVLIVYVDDGHGAVGEIKTTAAEIVALFTDHDLVAAEATSGAGAGTVIEMVATNLTGGKDTTEAEKGDICFDATNIYIALDDIAATDDGGDWRKVAHGVLGG